MKVTHITYGIDGNYYETLYSIFRTKKFREQYMINMGLHFSGDLEKDIEEIDRQFDDDPYMSEAEMVKLLGYPSELEVPKKIQNELTYFDDDDRFTLMDYVNMAVKPKLDIIDLEFEYEYED